MPAIFQQRLWLFLLIGLVLFGVAQWRTTRAQYVIHIDDGVRAKLIAQWQAQTGDPPTTAQLESLLAGYVREEVLVREARALGLADGDVIIRRRLVQKLEYLLDAQSNLSAPDDDTLRAFFETQRARYQLAEQIGFLQIPLAPGQTASELRVILMQNPERWRQLGAPSMLAREWLAAELRSIEQNFGAEFAQQLAGLARQNARDWRGPLPSVYGKHLVRITAYQAPKQPEFAAIKTRLRQDWIAHETARVRAEKIAALRQKYQLR